MMRRRIYLWMGFSILFASLGLCREGLAQNAYKVKKGDTLYRIAEKAGISVSDLRQINRLRGNRLKIGQKLTLKKSSPPTDAIPTEFTEIEVNPGLSAEESLNDEPVTEEAQV